MRSRPAKTRGVTVGVGITWNGGEQHILSTHPIDTPRGVEHRVLAPDLSHRVFSIKPTVHPTKWNPHFTDPGSRCASVCPAQVITTPTL